MTPPQPTANATNWLKQVPSTIALLDPEFLLVDASDNWRKKFDLQEDDIKGKTLFELFPRFSENDWATKLKYALDGLKDIQIMDKTIQKDGQHKNLIWFLNPWKDGYGNTIGVTVNITDVTKTKELQIELERTKNLANEQDKMAKIGSWEYDVKKNEVSLSPMVRKILHKGAKAKVTKTKAIEFFAKGPSRKRIQKVWAEALKNGTPWEENLQLTTDGRDIVWVNMIGRPKFKDGQCARIIGTVQDVTEKVSLNGQQDLAGTLSPTLGSRKFAHETDDVESLRSQVKEAHQHIDKLVNFAHMVSHNLRGHATNFSLLLNFLDKVTGEKEQQELVSILRSSNDNLTETIKGLREIVAIRQNAKLERKSVVLNDYIYKAEESLSGVIKKESPKIINEIEENLKVDAVPVYLESILTNCLSNAIRFKKPGKPSVIILSAEKEETTP